LPIGRVVLDLIVPKHVAVIMDGNGRWAELHHLPRVEGHKAGTEPVKMLVRLCLERKISYLSLFAFSSENWQRPAEEVNALMTLFIDSLETQVAELNERGVRLCFTGDRSALLPVLQARMAESEKVTQSNDDLTLNIVINYGGRWDIVNAAKKIIAKVQSHQLDVNAIDEALFERYLDTYGLPDPDLFIRTSGELRVSNFFLWQLAYTELYFSNVYWPDFNEQEFDDALTAFSQRQRRYGKVL
jgi:undecaprenyl diphosphate synthase